MPISAAQRTSAPSATWTRDGDAGRYHEALLVSGVTAVLAIRGYLAATGYPQVGGGELHVAHMLWGGLFLLAALVALLSFLGKPPKMAAAILGGAGLGTFIDELGKFITKDNDYFYKPTIALIYVVFVALFLATQAIRKRRPLSPAEHLANALASLDALARGVLDARTRDNALRHLDLADPANPLVPATRQLLLSAPPASASAKSRYVEVRSWLARRYRAIAERRWFAPAVAAVFVVQAVGFVGQAIALVVEDEGGVGQDLDRISFVEAGNLLATVTVGGFVVLGVVRLPRSRPAAFRAFDRALLVGIFFAQFFAFAQDQFGALGGLAVSLVLLAAVRYVLSEDASASQPAPPSRPARIVLAPPSPSPT